MLEAGLKPHPPFVGPPERFVQQILNPNAPTAVLVFDHWGAVRLLQQLWRKGLRVPDDISVATFNDTYPVAEVIPPLTTVSLPAKQMAENAVRLLMERIEHPEMASTTMCLEESLVVRESTTRLKR